MSDLARARYLPAPAPGVQVVLTLSEVEALLRAVELVRILHLARNRRERPSDLRHEEAAEEKLRCAMRPTGRGR